MIEPSAPHVPSAAGGEGAARALPAIGERLGVWRVAAELYECASGFWYRVEHGKASAQTGMALVYRHDADAQAVLMRFAEDSEALARFQYPVYGAPLDSGLSPSGLPYLVVPAMDGAPLLRVAMALPLLLDSRPGWLRRVGRWIAPEPSASGAACGGCDGCGPEPPRK